MKNLLRLLVWLFIAALGAAAVGVIALRRNEPVNALWIVTAGLCAFAISYRFYSKWLTAKVLVLDERRAPPAVVRDDGRDFVPTNKWMVFGHHFAAIAGPGPLVGPVLAAQFGYLPGTLWILIGATLGGGVHDAITMFASIRRDGKSLGQMVKEEISGGVGVVALVSVLAIMVILLAVLALVVVKALAESPWGLFTIAMTVPIAVAMGLLMRFTRAGILGVTIFGIIALLASVWAGGFLHTFPLLGNIEPWFLREKTWLAWAIIIYGFVAASLPMWLLLTPRDYLSTFLKLGAVAALALAIIALRPDLHMPALTKFIDGTGPIFAGPVFPFVCITIACGAVSGFHSLIASGTTPKLVTSESAVRTIGYGAMVTEMVVALMAMIAACALDPGQYFAINVAGAPAKVVHDVTAAGFPVTESGMAALAAEIGEKTMFGRAGGAPTFAVGMAHIFARALKSPQALALWYHFAIMFEALFILTTIDAGTRVGRFLLQDFLGNVWRPLGNTGSWGANLVSSGLLVGAWGYFLYQGVVDPNGGINSLWPIFGIANQLLAVIALCLGTTLLLKMGKRRHLWITAAPLAFLIAVTFSAGWMKIFSRDPRIGFLAGADVLAQKVAGGKMDAAAASALIFNAHLDAVVTGVFLLLVFVIVAGSMRAWIQFVRGARPLMLNESPFVDLEAA